MVVLLIIIFVVYSICDLSNMVTFWLVSISSWIDKRLNDFVWFYFIIAHFIVET